MVGHTTKIEVGRSQAAVWAYMANMSNAPDWLKGVTHVDRKDHGPLHEGEVLKETRADHGNLSTRKVEVTKLSPPNTLEWAEHAPGVDYIQHFDLRPRGQHCEVELHVEARTHGLLGAFAGGKANQFIREDDELLHRLKEAVEGARMERMETGLHGEGYQPIVE